MPCSFSPFANAALSSSDLVASRIDVTLGNFVSPNKYLLTPSTVALDRCRIIIFLIPLHVISYNRYYWKKEINF